MVIHYRYDHIHVRTKDQAATDRFYEVMLNAKVTVEPDLRERPRPVA